MSDRCCSATRLALLGMLLACASGCSQAPLTVDHDGPPVRPQPSVSGAHASSSGPRSSWPQSSGPQSSGPRTAVPSPPPPADTPPAACPSDMVLVAGTYCNTLETRCLKKWEAPQNHLWVCEEVAEPTKCKDGPTESTEMRFCIDRYEFPNRPGKRPMVMQNFYQAQMHCAERGKRVCTESEWTKACEGPKNKPFPYGYVRDPSICHGDQRWGRPDKKLFLKRDPNEIERLWQGKVSGSQPKCVSDYGVFDMPANADELAASETRGGPKSNFDNVTTGGPWYKGVRNQCRPKIYSHDESFAYYYLSWRCCAEPDGQPTDPRAPKQIARGWSWERVQRIGNNSWNLPFNPKVPGDPGYSAAGPDRTPVSPD